VGSLMITEYDIRRFGHRGGGPPLAGNRRQVPYVRGQARKTSSCAGRSDVNLASCRLGSGS
jgi:hypothetical protein